MKIVIVNYRYFVSGGPERYMFNIMDILQRNGHEVIPFSVINNNNIPSRYESYFLSKVGKGDEIYANQVNYKSLANVIKSFARMVYSTEAKRKLSKLLRDEKPDLVYVLYFQSKMSASIFDAIHSAGVPVVVRVSDFSMIAPCNIYYRTKTNEICELCSGKNKLHAIKYKCVNNSTVFSAIKSLSLYVQRFQKIQDKIDAFVFPSAFTLNKFVEAGFEKDKMHYIPTLFNYNTVNEKQVINYNNFCLYIGRIEPEKGLETLLDAFIDSDWKLVIIGFSSGDYENILKEGIKNKQHNISFVGKKTFDEIQEYLTNCLFTIIPSECYENLPNTLLESFAFSKCVVATNIGSLAENITHKSNGMLFKFKDADSLKDQINFLFKNPDEAKKMGQNAGIMLQQKYSESIHYKKLITLFKNKNKTI